MASLQDRMIRAAKLDVQLYEEVEADQGAMAQAMTVVILSALAAGIGNANVGLVGMVSSTIAALIGWYVWAFLTYFIGTRFLAEPQTRADHRELLRTIGFSSAPGLIRVLGIIPGLRALVFLVAGIWMLVAMVIAVRQALDYTSTGRAIGVCVIGWVVQILILAVAMMTKATLITGWFMHLKFETRFIMLCLVLGTLLTAAFLVFLLVPDGIDANRMTEYPQ